MQVVGELDKVEKEGLYSPFTSTGTYYIFPEDF